MCGASFSLTKKLERGIVGRVRRVRHPPRLCTGSILTSVYNDNSVRKGLIRVFVFKLIEGALDKINAIWMMNPQVPMKEAC